MHRSLLLGVLAFTLFHCYGSQQLQMPVTAELQQPDDDLQAQIKELQRNVSDVWTYIYQLRNAVSGHLTHLRQHQEELESSMHKMEHLHESELRSSGNHHSGDEHSHSGEHQSHVDDHHSHGDEHHSHGDEHHSHGNEHHSHGDEHSHGNDHSHGSMEGHSHSGEQHSHSGEHHSHSDEHGHHSHSHSVSSHDHSKEDSHSHDGGDHHHHDHKDSHETEDLSQQTQQVAETAPVAEPIIVPTTRQDHSHHHSHSHSQSSRSGNADTLNLMNENSFNHHHHHDHNNEMGSRSRNKTVELPRYSDYGQYDLALCRVEPNRAIPEDQQQDITGTVTLWQKKSGGPLNLHVRLQGFDVGGHHGHHQTIQSEQDNETPQAVGHRHGFHIHASGDLSNGCQSAGSHYNPKGVNHGGPHALVRHVGDLGNIECDEHGFTNIMFSDDVASLKGQYSIIGRAIVIHQMVDDLGLGGDAESLRTGNAGTRLACCVIQKVDKIPIRQYKAMKSASQFQNR